MTIIFNYFQYLNYFTLISTTIPSIITAIFLVISNIFILISSKGLREEIEKTNLLKSAAIINIIFSILPLTLPMMAYSSPTEIEKIIAVSYLIFLGLISSLPFFITYGLFFFLFGKANQERYNIFLKVAGILWMVSFGFSLLILSGFLGGIIYILTGIPPLLVITNFTISIINIINIIIELNGFVLLMIHGIKNDNKNLMKAGILRLVALTTVIIYIPLANYLFKNFLVILL